MDEIHTPDSSRYFYAEGYEDRLAAGLKQKQLSKEFVREWLMANGFQGQEGQEVPEMTEEIVDGITDRYVELYENIVGEKFEKAEGSDILTRIEKNVTECHGITLMPDTYSLPRRSSTRSPRAYLTFICSLTDATNGSASKKEPLTCMKSSFI